MRETKKVNNFIPNYKKDDKVLRGQRPAAGRIYIVQNKSF